MIVASLGDTVPGGRCAATACHDLEAVFFRMKRAAEAAKWPVDLSPRVVELDKAWQTAKQDVSPNQAYLAQLGTAMREVTALLNARVPKPVAIVPPLKRPVIVIDPVPPPAPPGSLPWYAIPLAVAGVGGVALLVLGARSR